MRKGHYAALAVVLAFASQHSSAYAEIGGDTSDDGANVGMTQEEVRKLPPVPPRSGSSGGSKPAAAVLYEYKTSYLCSSGEADDPACQRDQDGAARCEAAGLPGPMAIVWRREVGPSTQGPWAPIGQTCFPEDVPGGQNRPQLTMAIIRSAWSRTDFAKPQVSMQPVGNKTLVTLPVFFRIIWPEAGFEPGEVNTVNLLGYTVRIRPTFQANQYHYGDGQASGPTRSFGGVYPSGDIRHEYSKKGSYAVHASTRYGGEFAVEGGGWMTLPGTTSVVGPQEQLQVVTAKNRLVQ